MSEGLINKIITGTSGILNTVNKIIPLYEEIKPLVKSINNIKNRFKNINIPNIFNTSPLKSNKNIYAKEKEEKTTYSSLPQFFA